MTECYEDVINPLEVGKRLLNERTKYVEEGTVADVGIGDIMITRASDYVVQYGHDGHDVEPSNVVLSEFIMVRYEAAYCFSNSYRIFIGTMMFMGRNGKKLYHYINVPQGFSKSSRCDIIRWYTLSSYIRRFAARLWIRVYFIEWMKKEENFASLHNKLWSPETGIMPRASLRELGITNEFL